MAKKSSSILQTDASKVLEQRRNMTPKQREGEMNKVVSKVSGKQSNSGGSGKGPLGSRKKLSGPRNKSKEQSSDKEKQQQFIAGLSGDKTGAANARLGRDYARIEGESFSGIGIPDNLPNPGFLSNKPSPQDQPASQALQPESGYQTPNYESYGADDLTADTSPNEPMAYKTSMATYKLPGGGSRENYSEGIFRATDYAVGSGNLRPKGFGDLSGSYKGSTPALEPPIGSEIKPLVNTDIINNTPPPTDTDTPEEEEDKPQGAQMAITGYQAGPAEKWTGMEA